jgi:hypothetical protein
LREQQQSHDLEDKIEAVARQVHQLQQAKETDAMLLQDLSEDLKNALAYGTITEEEVKH